MRLLSGIGRSQTLEDVAEHFREFEQNTTYQIVHIGTFRLNGVPVKDVIYSREIKGTGVKINDYSDEIKWGVCAEAEALRRPFNLRSHVFQHVDDALFAGVRKLAATLNVEQLIAVPVLVQQTSAVVIYSFPEQDFDKYSEEIPLQAHRIVTSIFDRFPSLLNWTEEAILSEREKEVLRYTARGLSEPEIASELKISRNTVRNHLSNARMKLDARNKVHAVSIAVREGEIDLRGIDRE